MFNAFLPGLIIRLLAFSLPSSASLSARPSQAAAILKAEVHGIARPAYASSAAKVAEAADKVPVEPFVPKKGVHIETDPKVGGISWICQCCREPNKI